MGGHAAWRKRIARGELAKGSGGAIMRHRPHRGRKGKDLILNRKGHIGGGNPKKMKKDKPEVPVSRRSSFTTVGWMLLAVVLMYAFGIAAIRFRTRGPMLSATDFL